MSIRNEPPLSRNNNIVEPPTLNNNSVNCIFFSFFLNEKKEFIK